VGQFGGGAVFVTAKTICWQDAGDFVERKRTAFMGKRESKKNKT